MDTPAVRVTVPPDERFARVLRIVASATGAAVGLAVDRLDELKLAIDEAVGLLLEGSAPAELSCTVDAAPAGVAVSVTGTGGAAAAWPPVDWDDSLGAMVLGGVTTELALVRSPAGPAVTFTVG
jgi:hypothetical protein